MMPYVEDRDDELYQEEEEYQEQEESSKKVEFEGASRDNEELGNLGISQIIPPTSFSFPSTSYHQILAPAGDVRDVAGRSATAASAVQTEHMFDKVVTPSDVGKLNRLVIPKQHAEKYFPLDSSTNEKGLLLSFEDRSGKQWRFRYSYWNSSQSYVMTKGWSRFVKDKKLDAGDIVTFERGVGQDHDRLFIDWKRRPSHHPPHHGLPMLPQHRQAPWGRVFFPTMATHLHHVHPQLNYGYGSAMLAPPSPQYNFRIPAGAVAGSSGSNRMPMVIESIPVAAPTSTVTSSAPGKRFRLFGVNLDCAEQEPNDFQRRRQPELELELYHGGETTPSSSSAREVHKKEKQSALSLDLDI